MSRSRLDCPGLALVASALLISPNLTAQEGDTVRGLIDEYETASRDWMKERRAALECRGAGVLRPSEVCLEGC